MYQYEARVARVVDGDTVDLVVDLGFRVRKKDRFRLAEIDTPERGQVGWSEAKQAVEALLPVGSPVIIATSHPAHRDPADKYGRWLATISNHDGINVNQYLLHEGLAKPYGA